MDPRNKIYNLNAFKFQHALKELIGDKYNDFNDLIIQHSALIIGKGPVDILVNEPLKEIDIYVSKKNFIQFTNEFKKLSSDIKLVDQLFSDDHKLLCVYPKFFYKHVVINIFGSIFDQLRDPVDLGMTCNQLWYDGKIIKTTHFETLDKISYYNSDKNFSY